VTHRLSRPVGFFCLREKRARAKSKGMFKVNVKVKDPALANYRLERGTLKSPMKLLELFFYRGAVGDVGIYAAG
jgi:hypothetical protein